MQLTLFDWPPLASHTACLLAGLAMAHVLSGEQPKSRAWPAGTVMVTLAKGMMGATHDIPLVKRGDRVFVIGKIQGTSCRFHEESFVVVEDHSPPVLSIPAKSAVKALRPLLGESGAAPSVLSPEAAARHLPLCHQGPRVSYGSN